MVGKEPPSEKESGVRLRMDMMRRDGVVGSGVEGWWKGRMGMRDEGGGRRERRVEMEEGREGCW